MFFDPCRSFNIWGFELQLLDKTMKMCEIQKIKNNRFLLSHDSKPRKRESESA